MRRPPPEGVRAVAGYWVIENQSALPRAFVPRRVEMVNDKAQRLARLGAADFRPADVALVESTEAVSLENVSGTAWIQEDLPSRVTVEVTMDTKGLLVLADQWDAGWKATYKGREVPVLPADHALRGVVLPAGKGTVVFTYEPASFTWGVRIFIGSGIALLIVAWVSRPERAGESPKPR
jgi:hypothetical protein